MRSKQYGPDVLADGRRRTRPQIPEVPAERDLVVEESGGGFCGVIIGWEQDAVTCEDRLGRRRVFPLPATGFLVEGKPVTLVRPRPSAPRGPDRTASGSVAVQGLRARVARESRIYVEGVHDAELVERIWGDDLRVEGVVVEYLEGVDQLPSIVAEFDPGPGRRLGVLVDHLVPGSKESRIASAVSSEYVLVTGHPFVDIWQAVKPSALGIRGWPDVPRGTPWKEGVLAALGWPDDVPGAWRRILAAVGTYTDLEPTLLGRVEELIDFVTAEH
ncbi:MAG: DUF3097 family protein [Streptosporangiales bacterium]|nr:DUF3097 family protein [Streptosporangiales bacterium]